MSSIPGRRPLKQLYLCKCLEELNKKTDDLANDKLANQSVKNLENARKRLCDAAEKAYFEGDEELAYIYFMRLINLLKELRAKCKEKVSFVYMSDVVNKCEDLIKSLEKRYSILNADKEIGHIAAQLAESKVLNKDKIGQENEKNSSISQSPKMSRIQSYKITEQSRVPSLDHVKKDKLVEIKEIKNKIDKKVDKILFIDVRSSSDFEKVRLNLENCISIPSDKLCPGITAGKLTNIMKTSDNYNPSHYHKWVGRTSCDLIVLLDMEDETGPIHFLYDAMTKWDLENKNLYDKVKILKGGYTQVQLTYPTLLCGFFEARQLRINNSNNSSSSNNVKNNVSHYSTFNELSNIQYPDTFFEKPKPIVSTERLEESKVHVKVNVNGNNAKVPLSQRLGLNNGNFDDENYNTPASEAYSMTQFGQESRRDRSGSESPVNLIMPGFEEPEISEIPSSKSSTSTINNAKNNENYENQVPKSDVNVKLQDQRRKPLSSTSNIGIGVNNSVKSTIQRPGGEGVNRSNVNVSSPNSISQIPEFKRKDLKGTGPSTSTSSSSTSTSSTVSFDRSTKPKQQFPIKLNHKSTGDYNDIDEDQQRLSNNSSPLNTSMKRSQSIPNLAQININDQDLDESETNVNSSGYLSPTNRPSYNRGLKPAINSSMREFHAVSSTDVGQITGLRNLGNTCYMNSIFQCIYHTKELYDYFIFNSYSEHLVTNSKTKGDMSESLACAFREMSRGHRSISLHQFKFMFGKYHTAFKSNDQQDSHEYLTIMLESLHDELNVNKKNEKKTTIASCDDNNDEIETSLSALEKYTNTNKSKISDLFCGQQKSSVRCGTCSKVSITYEPFFNLSLPIPMTYSFKNKARLKECLDLYTSEESVSDWACPKCRRKGNATKKIDLTRLPPYLIIHFQRFYNDGYWKKRLVEIDFPLDNFSPPVDIGCNSPYYNLYGVSNHYGTMDGGHYTGICRRRNDPRSWYKFDDHEVSEINHNQVCSSAAYILFYSSVPLH